MVKQIKNQITHTRPKPTEPTPGPSVDPSLEVETITQDELISESSEEVEYTFDEEAKTVVFQLVNGTQVTLKEPKPKKFFQMEDWARGADEEYKSPYFLMIKLALICSDLKKSLEQFLDELDNFEDGDRLVGALQFFPIALQQYKDRLEKLNRVNLQLPG